MCVALVYCILGFQSFSRCFLGGGGGGGGGGGRAQQIGAPILCVLHVSASCICLYRDESCSSKYVPADNLYLLATLCT